MMIDLIHGDCLEVMDELIEEGVKVDLIMTSPPYADKRKNCYIKGI
jgi:site-specific DNA-methyltransferase (adenine-specific)